MVTDDGVSSRDECQTFRNGWCQTFRNPHGSPTTDTDIDTAGDGIGNTRTEPVTTACSRA
jgi:hypothetical protein